MQQDKNTNIGAMLESNYKGDRQYWIVVGLIGTGIAIMKNIQDGIETPVSLESINKGDIGIWRNCDELV